MTSAERARTGRRDAERTTPADIGTVAGTGRRDATDELAIPVAGRVGPSRRDRDEAESVGPAATVGARDADWVERNRRRRERVARERDEEAARERPTRSAAASTRVRGTDPTMAPPVSAPPAPPPTALVAVPPRTAQSAVPPPTAAPPTLPPAPAPAAPVVAPAAPVEPTARPAREQTVGEDAAAERRRQRAAGRAATRTTAPEQERIDQAARAAEARRLAQECAARVAAFAAERQQLITTAEQQVGLLRTPVGQVRADPAKAHIFAEALQMVVDQRQPMIADILRVAQKHRAAGAAPVLAADEFSLESGAANDAAQGMGGGELVDLPIDASYVHELEQAMAAKQQDGTVIDADVVQLRSAITRVARNLAPTVIHELTHMALYKMYRNASSPWIAIKTENQLKPARQAPAVDPARLAAFAELANDDFRTSDLKAAVKEMIGFEEEAPPDVAPVCKRLKKYELAAPSTEIASHLMEIVYLRGEDYVRENLPLGYPILIRIQRQIPLHLTAQANRDWFPARIPGAFGVIDDD